MQSTELEVFALVTGLLGGLALFLFGMEQMSEALKKVAGSRMRWILGRLTANRFAGVATGALVTAVIQSSSVTTVLVVGFITAGLMSMSQSIGVIMGANIGTTITAQIVAFKVTTLALLMVALGFGVTFFSKKDLVRTQGTGLMGLGLVFFGMTVMGDAMAPLRSYEPFIEWMTRMENPALGIMAGTVFTAVIQSSSATTGVVIALATQGLITLPAGIALIFGANIGTCVTAMLAALGKPREAMRAAVVHVTFNIAGVLVWIAFIPQLADAVTFFSPAAEGLSGAALLAAEVPRQVANAHTVFNVANTFIFIWFAPLLGKLVNRVVPDRPSGKEEEVRARYLDAELLRTPALALDRARLELLHMSDTVREMYLKIMPALINGPKEALDDIRKLDDKVDILHGKIVTYLGKISGTAMSDDQVAEMMQLLEAANDLENIGDVIETNLVNLGYERLEHQVSISAATKRLLEGFHAAILRALDSSMQAVTQRSVKAAVHVRKMKKEIRRLSEDASAHQASRLVANEPNRLPAYTVEIDIIQNLHRIYYFCKRMARTAAPAHVENGIES